MKKLGFVLLPLLAASFLVNCGGGGDNPGPKPDTYTISTETQGVTITPTSYTPKTATGEYVGTISIQDGEYQDYKLPDNIENIYYVGSETQVKGFKYKKNGDKEATLTIPKKSFTDDIEFSLQLVEPGAYIISTETFGITIDPTSYTPDTATDPYSGTIKIIDAMKDAAYKLPENEIEIYYDDGSETPVEEYTYTRHSDDETVATLEIPKDNFNGDIKFSLDLIEPDTYTVSPDETLISAGVTIDPVEYTPALEDDDYIGTIEADPADDKTLPETIKSVIRGDSNTDIKSFCTYTRDDEDEKVATLIIPKEQFTGGNITFSLEIIDPTPDNYSIGTKTPGLTIEPAIFSTSPQEDYVGTITVNNNFDGGLLPETINSVWLNDEDKTEITNFDYTPTTSTKNGDGYTEATLTIPKESFTYDVEFDLTLVPTLKTPMNFKCLSCDSDAAGTTLTITNAPMTSFSNFLHDSSYDLGVDYSWDCVNWEAVDFEELDLSSVNFELYVAIFNLHKNDVIYFRWDNPTDERKCLNFTAKVIKFASTEIEKDGELALSGNIMSLMKKEGFETLTSFGEMIYVFDRLFWRNENLVDASNLLLPATTTVEGCYAEMFQSCGNLITAPKLPATQLSADCYASMFENCDLIKAPELPATTLVNRCYYEMFYGCMHLNYVKVGFGTSSSQAWPAAEEATESWLSNTASTGTFIWKGSDNGPETRSGDTVPSGWSINPK